MVTGGQSSAAAPPLCAILKRVFCPPFRVFCCCFFFTCEPMDASASAVKRWQLSGTDYDPDRVRSLASRFSAWTPLSDKRRNLQVRTCNAHSLLLFFILTQPRRCVRP